MDRIEFIRQEEKKYHDSCYENYTLFEKGSWLYKPVQTVMDVLPLFEHKHHLNVLDLGSGVGRNSIPIAQEIGKKNGKVVCVDLLDSALNKLEQYSEIYDVQHVIETCKADIGHYHITENTYDLIVAVSTLEHVESRQVFEKVIKQMMHGTKNGGVNCIIANSEIEEIDIDTKENVQAMMEVNLQTNQMIDLLHTTYAGWEVLRQLVKPLTYEIQRDDRRVLLTTNAVTFVARKMDNNL